VAYPEYIVGVEPANQTGYQPFYFTQRFLLLPGRIDYFIHQSVHEGRMRTVTRMGRQEMENIINVKPRAVHCAKDTGNRLFISISDVTTANTPVASGWSVATARQNFRLSLLHRFL